VLIAIVKSIKPEVGTKTQHVKSGKVLVCYPCINYSSIKHRSKECPQKIEVQNMFRINAMTTPNLLKTNNVLVNVLGVITTHNQQLEQQVFKEKELVKAKGAEEWQQEECLQDYFIEIIKQLQHNRAKN
jgi:hypothetical protein